jgi:hypothetical protein
MYVRITHLDQLGQCCLLVQSDAQLACDGCLNGCAIQLRVTLGCMCITEGQ